MLRSVSGLSEAGAGCRPSAGWIDDIPSSRSSSWGTLLLGGRVSAQMTGVGDGIGPPLSVPDAPRVGLPTRMLTSSRETFWLGCVRARTEWWAARRASESEPTSAGGAERR